MTDDRAHDEALGRVMRRLDTLEAKNESLDRENRALQAEVGELREAATRGSPNGRVPPRRHRDGAHEEADHGDAHLSRRGVFKLGGAAVGGAALAVGPRRSGRSPQPPTDPAFSWPMDRPGPTTTPAPSRRPSRPPPGHRRP